MLFLLRQYTTIINSLFSLISQEHPSVVSQLQEAFAGIVRDRSKRREALVRVQYEWTANTYDDMH